ncbi:protein kinase domain-containing protein [Phthorimaea operculella]|nr:protein kinase domain-containing protein [Phthorimaea operculella]
MANWCIQGERKFYTSFYRTAALSRWERDPTAAACRAYCGLRQELGVLTRLAHPHVVPLLGVCGTPLALLLPLAPQLVRTYYGLRQELGVLTRLAHTHVVPLLGVCGTPLALLLPLAPQGALDGVLRAYRGCGARVRIRAARALALQAARALEYLHARRIVYRDLKSENVLVWAMPRAQEAAAAERSAANIPVHIKLADYGISRLAPPSGTKGFGGTEGFMAPEIMRYNGEEEYNEKVDCFSYGMLLYEIITLRQPFEGHEAVKEAVLEGARPTLDTRELQYPCCMLECMRRCWLTAPELRPSAAALVCVGAAPEFTQLQDACQARGAAIGQATPIAHTEDGLGGWEVWYAGEPERVHTISATRHAFTQQHTIRIPPDRSEPVTVTAMCKVGNNMWLGDSAGRLSVYNISTCGLVWCVRLCEVVGGAGGGANGGGVASLLALQQTQRVAVALQCGRLFLVTSSRVETASGSMESEASFVLSELGAATLLCCLTAVRTPQGLEVWAGGDGLYSYTLTQGGVSAADILQTPPTVTLLAAPTENGDHCEPYVVAYTDPGVCVYQWSVRSKQQTARLDCSKLAPCSESLQSIAIDEHLADDRCKVTALCCVSGCVYVGTAWGCLIVCDALLRPLTVFRPFEEDLRVIVPLLPHGRAHDGDEADAMLATLGGGYRPLLNRFAPPQSSNRDSMHGGAHCLLWRTRRWLPD